MIFPGYSQGFFLSRLFSLLLVIEVWQKGVTMSLIR